VIVGLGDSFGSGEGNPAKKKDSPLGSHWYETRWWNADGTTDPEPAADCHRSSKSGFYKAVRRLKDAFPYFEFTYKNFACTGAVIDNLWRERQIPTSEQNGENTNGWTKDTAYDPQLEQVDAWMRGVAPNRTTARIDAMYLSIGGNDAGFAAAIKHCIELRCTISNGAIQDLHASITSSLADSYRTLKSHINSTSRYATPAAVVISEYPNFVKNRYGDWCESNDAPLNMVASAEWEYLWNQIGTPLLRTINTIASEFNWSVATMEDRYVNHVLCDSNTTENAWINNDEFATLNQGDDMRGVGTAWLSMGMVHPNNSGYEAYADGIEPRLIAQLVASSAPRGSVRNFTATRLGTAPNASGQRQVKFTWTPPAVSDTGRTKLSGYRILMKQLSSSSGSQTLEIGVGNTVTAWVNPGNLVFTIAPCGQVVDRNRTRGCGNTTEVRLPAAPTASAPSPFVATSTLPPSASSVTTNPVARP
jgi:lysophospholipase L1-like esterase